MGYPRNNTGGDTATTLRVSGNEVQMAKYDITYACGHVETVKLYGPNKDRERRIASMSAGVCDACYKARKDAEHAAANASAAAANAAGGLPALVGSEKQVAWAESLRAERLAAIKHDPKAPPATKAILLDLLGEVDEAVWWIETRSYGLTQLSTLLLARKGYLVDGKITPEGMAYIETQKAADESA